MGSLVSAELVTRHVAMAGTILPGIAMYRAALVLKSRNVAVLVNGTKVRARSSDEHIIILTVLIRTWLVAVVARCSDVCMYADHLSVLQSRHL